MKNTKISNKHSNISAFSRKKILFYENMIQKTVTSINKYKSVNIYGASEISLCIKQLEDVYETIQQLKVSIEFDSIKNDEILSALQSISNSFFNIFKTYGTRDIEDLLYVSFGNDYISSLEELVDPNIYDIIKNHVRPIGFTVLPWKEKRNEKKKLARNRIVEDFSIVETAKTLDCFDLARTSRNFLTKVYGIKIAFQNPLEKKTLIIKGLVDNLLLECFTHPFVELRLKNLDDNAPSDPDFQTNDFKCFKHSLSLKELLVYNNDELYNRFVGYMNQVSLIKQKPISQVVKEFINSELYGQRKTLIQLLLKENNPEFQYLSYLLYDLLSNDANNSVDTREQTLIYDSLPWSIRKLFRSAMKTTINYTKSLTSIDNSKIPLEQQICLLKADDKVKEKAMVKLKEVKAKSEDSGSKARQYLEGLLKIPFGIYKTEPILKVMKECTSDFSKLIKSIHDVDNNTVIPLQNDYTSIEMSKYMSILEDSNLNDIQDEYIGSLISSLIKCKRNELVSNIVKINNAIKMSKLKVHKLIHSGKRSKFMKDQITSFIHDQKDNALFIDNLCKVLKYKEGPQLNIIRDSVKDITDKWGSVKNTMNVVRQTLDKAVFGHENAKRQVERIIGQWMNGELTGYCFGFEGPPGVGKTSLAKKGLAHCLRDEEGNTRPFGFIPIGGSSNGSILDGHNYTYVGSTWGRIVDVLMESKCMNPIIFIDELDKVSRTEHGKEIIGILTHMVDPTQNDDFQDKYFNGISIDLSKALIIFSYNDIHAIDRILLDRIHRIKFESLTLKEKITITKNYLLPEIYKKLGLNKDVVHFEDDVIEQIIETYTIESGVRKLKELLFEILSEINLEVLKDDTKNIDIPIIVSYDDVKEKYLKDYREVRVKEIHDEPQVGIMNGLWANSLGKGGIIPIQTQYYPTATFLDLKLTGKQGDVMKESMNVAKTLAYRLTSTERQKELMKVFKETNMQGIHIHCPEGAVPKDGPSAGTAITISIISLFNEKKIKHDIAITGEINLQGCVTAIGGLKLKILGGIKAGIKEFIYPTENQDDFDKFMEDYGDNEILDGIKFHAVKHIDDVLPLVFVE